MSAVHLGKRGLPLAFSASAALVLATVTAGCSAPTAAASHRPAARAVQLAAGHRHAVSPRRTSGQAHYFADIVRVSGSVAGAGPLQIRSAATGNLVWGQPSADPLASTDALAIAAYDGGSKLLIARQVGDGCTSRLYRATLSARGRMGRLTQIGRVIRGIVTSEAASATGSVVGYFAGPCSKTASAYLAVLHVRTGQVRQWSGVAVYGSGGSVATGTALSMSENGRLAAFTGAAAGAGGKYIGQRVWVLRTSAAAGPIARRSRVVITRPNSGPQLSAVVLSPAGTALYLCTVTTKGTVSAKRTVTQTADIATFRTSNGSRTGTVARLTATGVGSFGQFFGCPMALAPGGAYLLAPYSARYGSSTEVGPLVTAARIRLAGRAARTISFQLPGSAGMSVVTGISIAW